MTIRFLVGASPQTALELVLVAGAAAAVGRARSPRWLGGSGSSRHAVKFKAFILPGGSSVHRHVHRHVSHLGGPCCSHGAGPDRPTPAPSSVAAAPILAGLIPVVCAPLVSYEQHRVASSLGVCPVSGCALRSRARARHRSANGTRSAPPGPACCSPPSSFRSRWRSPRAGNKSGNPDGVPGTLLGAGAGAHVILHDHADQRRSGFSSRCLEPLPCAWRFLFRSS